ncbi:MAG TPA: hypothetical protein DD850_06535, partial [Erwinia persicina]|nr:hypothetical protein [Erwinia persicina]
DALEKRSAERPAHLARLKLVRDGGRLSIAGSMAAVDSNEPGVAGFRGSTIIAELQSLESAQTWAHDNPYIATGVYKHVDIKPFKRAF